MCNKCSKSMADGSSYDPQAIGQIISTALYEGQATDEVIKKAYPEVMIYLEAKNIEPTLVNIQTHKDELIDAIATENANTDSKDVSGKESFYKSNLFKVIALVVAGFLLFKMMKND